MKKTALILEGGSFRTMFSAGVLDVFLENEISFDYVIGVSAGALVAINYLSKQKGRVAYINTKYNNDVKLGTTLIHSDRGSQYTSHAFHKVVEDKDLIHSMSRVSKCIDNGPMEGFWGTLKVEMFNLDTFDTPEYLDQKIKEYIEFFNNERVTLDMGLAIPTEEKILEMIA